MSLEATIHDIATRARAASERLAELGTRAKNAWLLRAAERLAAAREVVRAANRRDLREAEAKGVAAPLVARLELSDAKWSDMLAGLREVAALPDPVGRIDSSCVRPNVTVDAAALCVKAGNAVILRGGSEAIHSNLALGHELRAAAAGTAVPEDAVQVVPVTDRAAVEMLLREERNIDLVIPRGGRGLIRMVTENSRIPVIKHDAGVCHVFLDADCDAEMAKAIVLDSKIRQMAVCNGLETLLVHQGAARTVLPGVLKALHEQGVEVRGDAQTREVFAEARPATEADWAEEYLAPILAVRVVDDLDAAIAHIRRFGTSHTEVIVTKSYQSAQEFLRRVNSSTVGVNCSTAFADGQRLGLGAEIGISTSKLHAFGPMGLEELTTRKFVLEGEGQLRE